MRWAKANAIPDVVPDTMEERRAVTVVPMFAPSVKGNICSRVIMPLPTNGIAMEVVTELD